MKSKLRNLKKSQVFKNLWRTHIEFLVAWYKMNGKEIVHFMHIGKTGGTAIKSTLGNKKLAVFKNFVIVHEDHGFRLQNLPKGHSLFFFVRDPLDRYVSGFYSRYRMGRPANYNPWKNGEEEAFTEFPTPNALGEALSSSDLEIKERAKTALSSIGHVKTSYYDWFHTPDNLRKNLDKIKFVGKQETLTADFEKFKKVFGIPVNIGLPKDEVKSHKNPDYFDKHLSEEATNNLKEYYKNEYEFLGILYEEGLITKKYN